MSTTQNNNTETMNQTEMPGLKAAASEENRWVNRLEDLLKVKNVEELKSELGKLSSEVQSEIQSFDINAHLSTEAKSRLKTLEQRYGNVMRTIQKAQKQFDREFNKSLRVLKRTKQDAEKHLKNIKSKIAKHRGTLVKASSDIRKKMNKKMKKSAPPVKRAKPVTKAKAKH